MIKFAILTKFAVPFLQIKTARLHSLLMKYKLKNQASKATYYEINVSNMSHIAALRIFNIIPSNQIKISTLRRKHITDDMPHSYVQIWHEKQEERVRISVLIMNTACISGPAPLPSQFLQILDLSKQNGVIIEMKEVKIKEQSSWNFTKRKDLLIQLNRQFIVAHQFSKMEAENKQNRAILANKAHGWTDRDMRQNGHNIVMGRLQVTQFSFQLQGPISFILLARCQIIPKALP